MRAKWWWTPQGKWVAVTHGPDPGLDWRELEREPQDEAEAYAIARGMALAEEEGRRREDHPSMIPGSVAEAQMLAQVNADD